MHQILTRRLTFAPLVQQSNVQTQMVQLAGMASVGQVVNALVLLMGCRRQERLLLLDFAKWQRAQGADERTAIVEAGRIRLPPIVMTSVAFVAGHDARRARHR